jgi:hypothetical protein
LWLVRIDSAAVHVTPPIDACMAYARDPRMEARSRTPQIRWTRPVMLTVDGEGGGWARRFRLDEREFRFVASP